MTSSRKTLDNALDATWKHPPILRAAAENITDTVELAWAAARSVFGKQARPQHAIDLAKLFIDEARQRPPEPAVAEPTGDEDDRLASPAEAPVQRGEANAEAVSPSARKSKHGKPSRKAEVDLDASPAPRTRRTATVDEPPRAPTKVGRPARM